jgi:putative N6-adenine-specific DNA methylase
MMNLEKQLKRHISGPRQTFFATVLPGFESLCRQELSHLSDTIEVASCDKGGVTFRGRLVDLYRANLSLRTATRIVMRVAEFKTTNFRQLAKRIGAISWQRYLPLGVIPGFKVTSHRSRLYHSNAVAGTIRIAIESYWKALGAAIIDDQGQTLFVRLNKDIAAISIDSSGEGLYRRGLKTHQAEAPLRETTAAAILAKAGFGSNTRPILLDPMCGSGSFSLEAALMCKQMAPGLNRKFAFMQWPAFRQRQWNYLKNQETKRIRQLQEPVIYASDINPQACQGLSNCVQGNGLTDAVRIRTTDFFRLIPDHIAKSKGLVVLNPPYGQRLAASKSPARFYAMIEKKLCDEFKKWHVALIIPKREWVPGLNDTLKTTKLFHGGLKLTLLTGEL